MKLISKKYLSTAIVVIAALLSGCATQPIPAMSEPQSAGLAIDLALVPSIGLFSNNATQVYFAKIDNEDGLLQQLIIRSNFTRDGRAYLLNARPGTYVVVGALEHVGGTGSRPATTYFSKDVVEQSKVIVRKNDFVFMGRYVVDQSFSFDGADEVQAHYKNVIAPGESTSVFLLALNFPIHHRGSLREHKLDDQIRSEFVSKAKEDLAGTGWAARLDGKPAESQ